MTTSQLTPTENRQARNGARTSLESCRYHARRSQRLGRGGDLVDELRTEVDAQARAAVHALLTGDISLARSCAGASYLLAHVLREVLRIRAERDILHDAIR